MLDEEVQNDLIANKTFNTNIKNFRNAKEIFAKTKKYFKDNYGEGSDYYYSSENYLYACALSGEYTDIIEKTDRLLKLNNTFPEPADTDNIMCIKAITYRGLKKFDESEEYQKKHIEYTKKIWRVTPRNPER